MTELPKEKAFYFFTSNGNYTGESARSLEEFLRIVKEIDSQSLEFHLYREDFQRWIRDVLANEELAEELHKITRLNLKGESLRTKIYNTALNFAVRKKKRQRGKATLKTETPSVEEYLKEYPPPPEEHAYELKMEKHIKRLLDEQKKMH